MKTTKRQRELLRFIKDFYDQHNYSPSIREMCKYLNVTSGSVMQKISALEIRGYIKRKAQVARTIKITTEGIEHLCDAE